MKPNEKSRMRTVSKALVDDLSAVRAALMHQRQGMAGEERAGFEARFFESWVIDKLAQYECRAASVSKELAELRQEFAALRKELQRSAKPAPKKKG